jgi:hypothetical protein
MSNRSGYEHILRLRELAGRTTKGRHTQWLVRALNGGRGRAGGYDPRHAHWHGPYDDLEAARQASNSLPDVIEHKECRSVG